MFEQYYQVRLLQQKYAMKDGGKTLRRKQAFSDVANQGEAHLHDCNPVSSPANTTAENAGVYDNYNISIQTVNKHL